MPDTSSIVDICANDPECAGLTDHTPADLKAPNSQFVSRGVKNHNAYWSTIHGTTYRIPAGSRMTVQLEDSMRSNIRTMAIRVQSGSICVIWPQLPNDQIAKWNEPLIWKLPATELDDTDLDWTRFDGIQTPPITMSGDLVAGDLLQINFVPDFIVMNDESEEAEILVISEGNDDFCNGHPCPGFP